MQFFSFIDLWRREFSGYNLNKFRQDLLAGLSVSAVALPLVLAFGVASGTTAISSIITAILAGLIIGTLSSTPSQISGPTAAMSALLIFLSQTYGIEGIWVAGVISGIILFLLGVFRLARFIAFVPVSVTTGFTSGIALIILIKQINNLFGITSPEVTWGWLAGLETVLGENSILITLLTYFQLNYSADWNSIFIAAVAMLTMITWPTKFGGFVPGSLVGLIASALLTWLAGFNIALIGDVQRNLFLENRLHFQNIPWANVGNLLIPILSITILSATESLISTSIGGSIGGSTGGSTGGKVSRTPSQPNSELIAQGIGNIIIPFFGGIPTAAALDRTSVGIKTGGVTRLVSIIQALVLLLSVLLFAPVFGLIPLAALAGILMVTAYRMIERKTINFMFDHRYLPECAIFVGIIVVILLFGLPWALILAAVGIAVFALYDKVIQSPSEEAASNSKRKSSPRQKNVAKGSKVINLQGNLFVTMLANLDHAVSEIDSSIHTVILSLQHVSMIDVAGVQAIIKLYDQLQGKGQHLMIAGANSTVKQMLIQGNVEKKLGADSLFANLNTALTQAEQRRGRFSITVEANEPVWNGTTALALFRPSQPETAKGRKKHK